MNTDEAIAKIAAARGPADLFGSGPSSSRRYRRLARLTHPDTCPGDRRAAAAFEKLTALWRQRHGTTDRLMAKGDIANLYRSQRGLIKLARRPADNDLMDREATALTRLRIHGDPRYLAYVPRLVETQRHRDPHSGVVRRANALGWLDGFHDLAEIRAAFPDGLDPRDVAWMWRRLLVAIGFAHQSGLVHAAVLPEHVMIHPGEHGLAVVDWCYSVTARSGPAPAFVGKYRDWYPAELLAGQPPGPGTDIYLATRCMTHLMGAQAPRPLTAFAAGCTLREPRRRPDNAWRLLGELDDLLDRCYGPRTFRPFAMPA